MAEHKYGFRIAIGFLMFTILAVGVGSWGWPNLSDCRPSGSLTYFGAPAPVGTRLQAKIQGVVVADTTVSNAGKYALSIPPDDPQTTTRDGWNPDDVITIWVGNHEARPIFAAFEGPKEINLVVSAIYLDVKKSTWGKIKALFR